MCEHVECVRKEMVVEETVHLVNETGLGIRVLRPLWDAVQVPGLDRDWFWRNLDEEAWRVSHSTWASVVRCFDRFGWPLGEVETPVSAPVLPFRPSVGTPAGWSEVSAPEL